MSKSNHSKAIPHGGKHSKKYDMSQRGMDAETFRKADKKFQEDEIRVSSMWA